MRIELTLTGATIQRSHQLSYRHHVARLQGIEPCPSEVLETWCIPLCLDAYKKYKLKLLPTISVPGSRFKAKVCATVTQNLYFVPQSGFEPLPSVCNTETLPLRHRGKCVYERTWTFNLPRIRRMLSPIELHKHLSCPGWNWTNITWVKVRYI